MTKNKMAMVVARPKVNNGSVPRGLTNWGQKIWSFMNDHKVKGNFRDFVLFVGDQMYDNSGQYTVRREQSAEGEAAYVALLHKQKLHQVIGEKAAEKFWNSKLKKRNNWIAHTEGWKAGHEKNPKLGN